MFNIAQAAASYRPHSEDRVKVIHRDDCAIIVVADGAGGLAGGAEAAELVISAVRAAIPTLSNLHDRTQWRRLLADIDARVEADARAGETTAVIAAVSDEGITGASVGDSAAWLITADGYDDLTRGQERRPFIGSGTAWPVGFQRSNCNGTLLVATDGLTKYASPRAFALSLWKPTLRRQRITSLS